MQEQEKKIYSFTGNGSRLQLLKIADKYVIRLNRKKICQTYNQEEIFRRMQHEINLLLMQKTINFEELEPIHTPNDNDITLRITKKDIITVVDNRNNNKSWQTQVKIPEEMAKKIITNYNLKNVFGNNKFFM